MYRCFCATTGRYPAPSFRLQHSAHSRIKVVAVDQAGCLGQTIKQTHVRYMMTLVAARCACSAKGIITLGQLAQKATLPSKLTGHRLSARPAMIHSWLRRSLCDTPCTMGLSFVGWHGHSRTGSSLPNALVAAGLGLLSTVALFVHVIQILIEKEAAG